MKKNKIISKSGLITLIILTAICVVPIIFSGQIWSAESFFYTFESTNQFLKGLVSKIPAMIQSVLIVVFAIDLFMLIKVFSRLTFKNNAKALTIMSLLTSLLKWVIVVVSFFFILAAFGVDTTTLLASAGILTLVIGLGAQSLIGDIIAGFFLVFEGEYQVGDIITVDGWRGTVIDIGIRVTRLLDVGGNIKTINNSDVKNVINQTNELSVAKVYMGIDYGESLEKAELVLKDNLEQIGKKIPDIIEGPYYKGVSSLSPSSVDLLFIAKCKETDIYQVERDLNRELYLVLVKNNIQIPFNQVTLSYRQDENKGVTRREEKEAKKFADEQKELAKRLEEDENK